MGCGRGIFESVQGIEIRRVAGGRRPAKRAEVAVAESEPGWLKADDSKGRGEFTYENSTVRGTCQ
jgi:hypothetical protein